MPWRLQGEWRYSSIVLDLGCIWSWEIRFTPLPLYPRGNNLWYQLYRGLGRPESPFWRCSEKKKTFNLPRIEPQAFQHTSGRRKFMWMGLYCQVLEKHCNLPLIKFIIRLASYCFHMISSWTALSGSVCLSIRMLQVTEQKLVLMWRVDDVRQTSFWSVFAQTGSRVLFEEPIAADLARKFSAFYGTQWFITVFIITRHWSLFCTRWIQSTSPRLLFFSKQIMCSTSKVY
jgi:hypothetical protein